MRTVVERSIEGLRKKLVPGWSELCVSLTLKLSLISCLLELLIGPRQSFEMYQKKPVMSPSETDTPASLPSLPHITQHATRTDVILHLAPSEGLVYYSYLGSGSLCRSARPPDCRLSFSCYGWSPGTVLRFPWTSPITVAITLPLFMCIFACFFCERFVMPFYRIRRVPRPPVGNTLTC